MIEIKKKNDESCCCKPAPKEDADRYAGCLLCGKPLVYWTDARRLRCAICGRKFEANCACEDGHFVCDACHAAGAEAFFVPVLLASEEKDPLLLLEQVMALPRVHMHGPEHHAIVPCVLLTAYRNDGGELELEPALREAIRRAGQVPGGACGYWGVCGAAAGAGIYASIVLGSNPLHKEAWPIPMHMTSACLADIAAVGGPRCCKRTSRLAIRRAAAFTEEWLGVEMPTATVRCAHIGRNRECIGTACPFFPTSREA